MVEVLSRIILALITAVSHVNIAADSSNTIPDVRNIQQSTLQRLFNKIQSREITMPNEDAIGRIYGSDAKEITENEDLIISVSSGTTRTSHAYIQTGKERTVSPIQNDVALSEVEETSDLTVNNDHLTISSHTNAFRDNSSVKSEYTKSLINYTTGFDRSMPQNRSNIGTINTSLELSTNGDVHSDKMDENSGTLTNQDYDTFFTVSSNIAFSKELGSGSYFHSATSDVSGAMPESESNMIDKETTFPYLGGDEGSGLYGHSGSGDDYSGSVIHITDDEDNADTSGSGSGDNLIEGTMLNRLLSTAQSNQITNKPDSGSDEDIIFEENAPMFDEQQGDLIKGSSGRDHSNSTQVYGSPSGKSLEELSDSSDEEYTSPTSGDYKPYSSYGENSDFEYNYESTNYKYGHDYMDDYSGSRIHLTDDEDNADTSGTGSGDNLIEGTMLNRLLSTAQSNQITKKPDSGSDEDIIFEENAPMFDKQRGHVIKGSSGRDHSKSTQVYDLSSGESLEEVSDSSEEYTSPTSGDYGPYGENLDFEYNYENRNYMDMNIYG